MTPDRRCTAVKNEHTKATSRLLGTRHKPSTPLIQQLPSRATSNEITSG